MAQATGDGKSEFKERLFDHLNAPLTVNRGQIIATIGQRTGWFTADECLTGGQNALYLHRDQRLRGQIMGRGLFHLDKNDGRPV